MYGTNVKKEKKELLLLLLLLLLAITFMRGIYNYIPEINHVSKVYHAAVPCFQFMIKFCNSILVLYEACIQFSVWSFL